MEKAYKIVTTCLAFFAAVSFLMACSDIEPVTEADGVTDTAQDTAADPCEGIDCGGNGRCAVVGGDTAVCMCDAGYHAEGLECVENVPGEECSGVDCSGHGTCVVVRNDPDYPFCACDEGYHNEGDTNCVADDSNEDPEFSIETVVDSDEPLEMAVCASLALDSSENPHIAYIENGSDGRLWYAYRTDSTWNYALVDDPPDMEASCPVGIALDSADNIHIGYNRGTSASTCASRPTYARSTGSDWDITVIDEAPNKHKSFQVLALDSSDNPHIVYTDYVSGYFDYDLNYASWTGSAWDIGEIDHHDLPCLTNARSLVLDSSDSAHITFRISGLGGYTVYCHWTGTSWDFTDLLEFINSDTTLALDSSGRPHMALYTQETSGQSFIYYTHWTGSTWESTEVEQHISAEYGTPVIALDSSGNPHIAYPFSMGGMKYALWTGSAWDISRAVDNDRTGRVYCLVLDSSNNPHILYVEQWDTLSTAVGHLKYLRLAE